MNPEFLSRLQFALTASFHFIFPPISMGLGIMLVWMAWKHVRTGDPVWRQASVFWVKVYGLVFALGIATGLVQEFAFGMNWSQYSRFVGNVFGSLLAAEGVFAFALEGGFLGLMLFGGDRHEDKGTMATIGRKAAVVQFRRGRSLTGTTAWLAWGTVHLALLSTGEDRAKAVVDWTWAGSTHERSGRIQVDATER